MSLYTYRATLLRVIDADTVRLRVDLGCDVRVDLTCRLEGIDAPETGTPEGSAATSFATDWLHRAPMLTVTTVKDRRERYGRYLVRVLADPSPTAPCLNDDLIAAGHARPYDGGKRTAG